MHTLPHVTANVMGERNISGMGERWRLIVKRGKNTKLLNHTNNMHTKIEAVTLLRALEKKTQNSLSR